MSDQLQNARFRLTFLFTHPGFRRAPIRVLWRAVAWEFVKLIGRDVTIRIHGDCRMRLHPPRIRHGHSGLLYVFREDYEPAVRFAIDRFVPDGATVFDIGANIGLWSLRMSRLVGPAGRVLSFEPVPDTARALRTNAELSQASNIEVVQVALGSHVQGTTVYVPGDAGRASLAPESAGDTAIRADQVTLDSVWIANARVPVPFVKIDIEGAEPLMFAGAHEFFSTCRPVVTCELNSTKLGRLGFSTEDIHSFFEQLGYSPHRWDDRSGVFLPNADREDGDVLFVPGQ